MRFVLFYHSLLSDWNHGNAHFLRGVVRELQARGHSVQVFEPADGWSRRNLVAEQGEQALARFVAAFPGMRSRCYGPELDLDIALDGADVVIVHEWNEPGLVTRIGDHRRRNGRYLLLFHDTHHRAVSAPQEIAAFELGAYDGVLAFGEVLREAYLKHGWARRAWTWHEAADMALFRPLPDVVPESDLIWIGNWGDEERRAELEAFLLAPVRWLGLRASVHGVRYPADAVQALADAGIAYRGWLPNDRVPHAFARHRVTVHVPRRPYVQALPGIPTIRVFEALACGIPLVSAPWDDVEGLFRPGMDYLIARDGAEMASHLAAVLRERELATQLRRNGLETIAARHSCRNRVEELLSICAQMGRGGPVEPERLAARG